MTRTKFLWLLLTLLAFFPLCGKSQVFHTKAKVDTLKWSERLSLHTNAVDLAMLIPNIGIEYDIFATNWNRWAIGVSVKSRWKNNTEFKQRLFYNVSEVRIDFRNYWRTRQIDNRDVKRHTSFIDRLFSCRRTTVKHPHTTYYRGLYAAAGDYSFLIDRKGRQGKYISGGVTYGAIYPLYVFGTGNSLDLDLGFAIGLVATNTEKFRHVDDCYERTEPGKWKLVPFPLPTSARVGFVYRFGKYQMPKKYKWRYDIDINYRERIDSINFAISNLRREKTYNDSITRNIYNDFWRVYDNAAKVNTQKTRVTAEKQKAEAEKLRLENERLKAEEKKRKEEEAKAEKRKGKNAKQQKAEEKKDEDGQQQAEEKKTEKDNPEEGKEENNEQQNEQQNEQ